MSEQAFVKGWNEKSKEAHRNSVNHGWWEGECNGAEKIALMHAELSEALEALRNGNPASDHIPEFSGMEEEFADVVIRIMDYSGVIGLRIAEAVEAKLEFNANRPYKHGGKAF